MIYSAHLDMPLGIMILTVLCIFLIGASAGAIITCKIWERAEKRNVKWWNDVVVPKSDVLPPPPSVKRRAYPDCPPY